MALKVVINLTIKVKRWGRPIVVREQREIRRCLMLYSTTSKLKEEEASANVKGFLEALSWREILCDKIKDSI